MFQGGIVFADGIVSLVVMLSSDGIVLWDGIVSSIRTFALDGIVPSDGLVSLGGIILLDGIIIKRILLDGSSSWMAHPLGWNM